MGVGPSDLLELVLQFSYHVVLAVFNLFNRPANGSDGPTIDVCSLEHFIKLQVLYLEFLAHRSYFFLEYEILESFLLLNGVDLVIEYLEKLLPFMMLVLIALHFDFVLVL